MPGSPCRVAFSRALIQRAGGTVTYRYRAIDAVAATVPHGSLASLRRLVGVRFAQPDIQRHFDGILDPTEPYQGTPEFIPWGVQDVRATDVWDANGNSLIDAGSPAGNGRRGRHRQRRRLRAPRYRLRVRPRPVRVLPVT
jgi:hypothetical protein